MEIAENPIDGAQPQCSAALRYPLHQIEWTDSLANVDVISSPALSVLGDQPKSGSARKSRCDVQLEVFVIGW
jgi:hypothetical protein